MNEDGFVSMAEWDLGMRSADRAKVLITDIGGDADVLGEFFFGTIEIGLNVPGDCDFELARTA